MTHHIFTSPSDYTACTNEKVHVVYGQELRDGVEMSGAFCRETLQSGEFICAWNGIQTVDSDELAQLSNGYDLTKYALSFPGRTPGEMIFSCVRLDKNGQPPRLPTPDSRYNATDVSLAVFLNEPSPDNVANYNFETQQVTILKKSRNAANVCLKTQRQRNGVLCPLMFSRRLIAKGEELTWDYGDLYDRRHYTYDEEMNVLHVSDKGYSATNAKDNNCKNTCDTVHFQSGLSISAFDPDMFLIEHELDSINRERIDFRTKKYFEHLASSELVASPLEKKRKRKKQTRISRRTITIENVHDQERQIFIPLRDTIDRMATDVVDRLISYKIKKHKNVDIVRGQNIIKHIILPALTIKYDLMYYIRVDFVLSKQKGLAFISSNESMWQDILKMQQRFFANIKSITDLPLKLNTSQLIEKFNPNTYTGLFVNEQTQEQETITDWNATEIREKYPLTYSEGTRFLNRLQYIQEVIATYDYAYTLYQHVVDYAKTQPNDDRCKHIVSIFELLLQMISRCAYARIYTIGSMKTITKWCEWIHHRLSSSTIEENMSLDEMFSVREWKTCRQEIENISIDDTQPENMQLSITALKSEYVSILDKLIPIDIPSTVPDNIPLLSDTVAHANESSRSLSSTDEDQDADSNSTFLSSNDEIEDMDDHPPWIISSGTQPWPDEVKSTRTQIRPNRQTSFSPVQKRESIIFETVYGWASLPYRQCTMSILTYLHDFYRISSKSKVIFMDGSNIFHINQQSQHIEWSNSDGENLMRRHISENAILVIVMKHQTLEIVKQRLPLKRLLQNSNRSEIFIVSLHVPFCNSRWQTNCLLKQKQEKLSRCSMVTDRNITDYQHLYCEYDDIILSNLVYTLSQTYPGLDIKILSLDKNVNKTRIEREKYNDVNLRVQLKIFTARL